VDAIEAIQSHREDAVASVRSSAFRRRTLRRHPFLDPWGRVKLGDAVPEVVARAEAW
jgi:hypothetical protein